MRIRGTSRWLKQDPDRGSSKGKQGGTNRSTEAAGARSTEARADAARADDARADDTDSKKGKALI